ncbi:metallothionein [Pseudomonas entomophila]|uniref:metallothionein n=1 Tax=Pseudomonas entomophila TaxID=312306 RepID=UPI0023D86483|nr:metallothionein [Pseudomonas entomophila]MDF0732157.1 metallothionein [Pseudomonas entomophila]
MNEQRCACPQCGCRVDASAVVREGKLYCCEACANGHRNGEPCQRGQCKCAEGPRPD